MTGEHPYPDHIKTAVARALFDHYCDSDGLDISAEDLAEVALQALWTASRVDGMRELKTTVPAFSILVDEEGLEYSAFEVRNSEVFPLHVVHWRDVND